MMRIIFLQISNNIITVITTIIIIITIITITTIITPMVMIMVTNLLPLLPLLDRRAFVGPGNCFLHLVIVVMMMMVEMMMMMMMMVVILMKIVHSEKYSFMNYPVREIRLTWIYQVSHHKIHFLWLTI